MIKSTKLYIILAAAIFVIAAAAFYFFAMPKQEVVFDVVFHPARENAVLNSNRTDEELERIADRINEIWNPADIGFDVSIEPVQLNSEMIKQLLIEDPYILEVETEKDGRIHVYFLEHLFDIDADDVSDRIITVADNSQVDPARALAHEFGHMFGLGNASSNEGRLMFQRGNGIILTQEEMQTALEAARAHVVD